MSRDAQGVAERSSRVPVKGNNCSASCITRDHVTYGECLRSKNLHVSPHVNDGYSKRQKAWDSELDHYDSAVKQGLSPASTKRKAVDQAIKEAENG